MPIFFDFVLGKLRYGSKTPAGATIASTKTDTFVDGDLVAGILTIIHNMNRMVDVTIKDGSGVYEGAMAVAEVSLNEVTVDFGGSIGVGIFTWIVTG